ncbi:MAG: trimethylamine methyltransferase family protein [Candidatus Aerophobus sp.]|nr:MAG: trimethylamine methyltransferase family protein [Candidatus Aerophobus sp.]
MIKGGQLKFLNQDQICEIYLGALDILQNTGVRVREARILKTLKGAGCQTDGEMAKMPTYLVEEAIRKAPSRFTICGRGPNTMVRMEDRRVYFEPMIGRLNILDAQTKSKRRTTLQDVVNLIKIADALPNYHILHSGAVMPHIEGIPDEVSHVYGYLASAKNSSKVIKGTCRGKNRAIDCIRMASTVAGGEKDLQKKPNIFTTYNVISPLEHGQEMLEGLIEYVKYGLPVDITSEPQMGATSPVTLAGTLTQQTAEVFSGIVIAQLLSPGTPVFFGTCGAAMDMRYGTIALGGIEAGLLNAAHAQIAQFLKIPSRGTGANTQSKVLDFQAGYEKTITLLIPAMAGINMVFYPGTIEHAETISLESLVIDHEICSIISRALRGIGVNENTLALDLINKVGPGGHFLKEHHTIDYLQTEHYTPKLADRRKREDWETDGSQDLARVAEEEVEQLLLEHRPLPLEQKVEEGLLQIVKEVEKRELKGEKVTTIGRSL